MIPTQKKILMVLLGLLITLSNGENIFNAKFDPEERVSNMVKARSVSEKPFRFYLFDKSHQSTGTPLCPAQLPIFCFRDKKFLCVEHDTDVFDNLNNNDDAVSQTVKFSKKGGITKLFDENEEFACSLAQKKTDLKIEEFGKIENTGLLYLLSTRPMHSKLEDIDDRYNVIALFCEVSNSDQVQYFCYHTHDDPNELKLMLQFTNKTFYINNMHYVVSCHEKTKDYTAKEAFNRHKAKIDLTKKNLAENEEKNDSTAKTIPLKIQSNEKWYKKYKYRLGLTLLFCIILVTLSLYFCASNNNLNNENQHDQYPATSDLVLDVLDTYTSRSTSSISTDPVPYLIRIITSFTIEECTQSNSVEPEKNTQSQLKSIKAKEDNHSQTKPVELKETTQSRSNSLELKEDSQSQTKSIEQKENTQSQSNSLELKENKQSWSNSIMLKEDSQSQIKPVELESNQSQSDALQPENTHFEYESLLIKEQQKI